LVSLSQLHEIPSRNMILLVGPPGSGKSTFCHQTVLSNIDMKPVIYVTTESTPLKVTEFMKQGGLGKVPPHPLVFVDAFHETVGLSTTARSDTMMASSGDLTSLGIAISKQQERIGEDSLLIFDSLTSPYLMNGLEVLSFIRTTLLRFSGEGNAVLACVDEGCGKSEDIVAMMSTVDGIVKIESKDGARIFNVMKHPNIKSARVEVPVESDQIGLEARIFDPGVLRDYVEAMILGGGEAVMRKEVGDFVNLFWQNFAHWSGMLWDPKRFPKMTYDFSKADSPSMLKLCREDETLRRAFMPWRMRLLIKLLPKNFSKVNDMKKMMKSMSSNFLSKERTGIIEYLSDVSKTDEHYIRVNEYADCWGFGDVGAPIASYLPPLIAGLLKGWEYWKGLERDWNAIETKCIGLGDPYCEFKVVPGEIDELSDSLEKDSSIIERIHENLMNRLMGFLLEGKPLVERPTLGTDIHLHPVFHAMAFPALAGERFRMALRMGGAKSGKEVGEHLMESGISEDESVKRVLHLLEYCKVGKVLMGETIRIRENCESAQTKVFATHIKEPSCFFTTGFFNGFFSAVKNQHVKETKCIAMGDPYCEWEFR
jgi:predicted hydrocarbon binding protein/KaiC/GvpD/RAD55 family RecA-like ATPase